MKNDEYRILLGQPDAHNYIHDGKAFDYIASMGRCSRNLDLAYKLASATDAHLGGKENYKKLLVLKR